MTFVAEILARLPGLAKPQLRFMLAMFAAFFSFAGRANRTNLHRYGAPSPRTQYRWARRDFDFVDFNLQALQQAGVFEHELVTVIDESFIDKSGQQSHGLGWFYDGCAGRARKGQALSLIGLVDLDEHVAYALDARQVPAKNPQETSLAFAARQYTELRPRLPETISICLADGGYAKKPFVDGVCGCGDTLISKLRKDASMRYLYTGPQKTGPGAPKRYDGKVRYDDLSRWRWMGEVEAGVSLLTTVLWHNSLKRQIRVVMLRWEAKGKWKHVLLFSTDPEMDPWQVYRLYSARFQIEFLFKDGKQHLGLADCQARDEEALHFHFNLSLAALNLLRIQEVQRGEGVISIASARRRKQNENLMNRIFSILGIDSTQPQIQPHLPEIRDYGVIAA